MPNLERKGCIFNMKAYHPECMPMSQAIGRSRVQSVYVRADMPRNVNLRCAKCGGSLFKKGDK